MSREALIVDDSLTVRMDLQEAFEEAGFETRLCSTIAEARDAIAGGSFAIVLLDVLLPDGDGVDLLSDLRKNAATGDTPIMLLSTEAEVRDRIRGLQTGADEYVGKPYDRAYVIARAKELVRRKGGAPSTAPATTVLVIDDSVSFREGLRTALSRAGYAVIVAASGEEGLRLAADRRPEAILVDGELPGIDGPTVIRRVRLDAVLRGVPCVLLTAAESGHGELRALDAGADAFVRKEEELDVVLAKLAAVLRSAPSTTSRADATSLLGPKKILAVDDSATYLQALAETLRGDGYEVILACSGEEALELLAVEPVDCILLDLMMPGLSGLDTCHRIKAAPGVRDVPLLMLTAREDPEAMIQGLSAGADDYIPKSSDFEILKARLRAQIRRKQLEDEARHAREELLRKEVETVEARAALDFARARAALADELERKNRELEAFSYSVSHDLRAPLRTIDGFSEAILDEYSDKLGAGGLEYFRRVRAAAQRMGELIDALLDLSRVGRAELRRTVVDLSQLAQTIVLELGLKNPDRAVETHVQAGLSVEADGRLLRAVLENLLGNAWKFTGKVARPQVVVGSEERDGSLVYFIRDNGAGFDMSYAHKLFSPFQRLHREADFPGTGIGLATVYRIVDRHGGRIWAEGELGKGATMYFTIPRPERPDRIATSSRPVPHPG